MRKTYKFFYNVQSFTGAVLFWAAELFQHREIYLEIDSVASNKYYRINRYISCELFTSKVHCKLYAT